MYDIHSLCAISSEELTRTLLGCFAHETAPASSNYGAAELERRLHTEHLDRASSLCAIALSGVVGILLVARRGRTSYLSGLGVLPGHRGSGIGTELISRACADATARGDRVVTIEVPTGASVARRLYERRGFQLSRRLVGYAKDCQGMPADSQFVELEPSYLVAHQLVDMSDDAPWYYHHASLAGCALPARAYALEDTSFAIVLPVGGTLVVRSVYTREGARRRGFARALLGAAAARHGCQRLLIQPLLPECTGNGFFEASGFARLPSSHDEMVLALN